MLDHAVVPGVAVPAGAQNHQQLSQLLAGNNAVPAPSPSSAYSISSAGGIRHSTVAATSVPRGGIVATLSNNIVRGNITLVPAAGGAPGVLGGGHPRVPTAQQQQQLVAINAGVGGSAPGATLLSVSSPPQNAVGAAARLQPMSAGAVMSLTAAGMVISVTQSQPGLPVSANGAHIGPTLVMPQRGVVTSQRFNATVQQNVMDGGAGVSGGSVPNVGLQCNPAVAAAAAAQMTLSAVAPPLMAGARVNSSLPSLHNVFSSAL